MKIAVSSTGPGLDALVDSRFGRCRYFVIVELDTMETGAIENQFAGAAGAGIAVAQVLVGKNIGAVLTGNCGPNAFSVLKAAGIEVVTGVAGTTVQGAGEAFKSGMLKAGPQPNVPGHFGIGSRPPPWAGGTRRGAGAP